jgi:hypothetical protein
MIHVMGRTRSVAKEARRFGRRRDFRGRRIVAVGWSRATKVSGLSGLPGSDQPVAGHRSTHPTGPARVRRRTRRARSTRPLDAGIESIRLKFAMSEQLIRQLRNT